MALRYVWNVLVSKIRENYIGSYIFHYLSNLPPDVKHVMNSDLCYIQNKNSILIAMCHSFVEQNTFTNIEVIDYKFMLSYHKSYIIAIYNIILGDGYSRIECDSDHIRIEKPKKLYSPSFFY